jgi:hypothetical protein
MRLPIRAESPLLTSSHAPVQGCLNCVWKLTDRGYELDVPPSTRTYPEAYFVWNFLVPEDLSKTQAAFTIKNPNSKSVFVRALAVSADGRPLPWADGGEVKVRAGETRDVSLTPARPAYEVTGFDAARINRIGVSLRVPADTDGVATVIIRGMRVGSAD